MGCVIDIDSLNVLLSCPDDSELVLFFNVVGQSTGMAVRPWSKVKSCLSASSITPIAGSVGDIGLPIENSTSYTDNRLKGLGNSTNGNVEFTMAGSIYYNYGNNPSFTLDSINGIITLLGGNFFSEGDAIFIDRNSILTNTEISGSVGDSGLPTNGTATYTDSRIAGLGIDNNYNIQFTMAGSIYYNYGNNTSFDYDPTGSITLLNGNEFSEGDSFNISLTQ